MNNYSDRATVDGGGRRRRESELRDKERERNHLRCEEERVPFKANSIKPLIDLKKKNNNKAPDPNNARLSNVTQNN